MRALRTTTRTARTVPRFVGSPESTCATFDASASQSLSSTNWNPANTARTIFSGYMEFKLTKAELDAGIAANVAGSTVLAIISKWYGSTAKAWAVYVATSGKLRLVFATTATGNDNDYYSSNLVVNKTMRVSFTYQQGVGLRLFANGRTMPYSITAENKGTIYNSNAIVAVGKSHSSAGTGGAFFNGKIRNVVLDDAVWTDEEHQEFTRTGNKPSTITPTAEYPLTADGTDTLGLHNLTNNNSVIFTDTFTPVQPVVRALRTTARTPLT